MLSVVQVVSAGIKNSPFGCAGFLQQFAAVIDDEKPHLHLGKALAELSGGRQPNRVICTGHSLGGALATLGAHFLPISCHASVCMKGLLTRPSCLQRACLSKWTCRCYVLNIC